MRGAERNSSPRLNQSCDYTSGLQRRRISIPMFNQIKGDRQKNLIEHKNGQMRGEFLPYIPGLLNWVLAMDEESATSIVKNYEANVPSLLAMKARTLVETNPIADWLDNFVVYEPEARTNVGVAKRDKDSNSPFWYLDTEKWLYPNYCEYCRNSATHPVSLRRFVTLLSDLGKNQLGLDIRKERDRFGSYFVGLKIRGENDHEPLLITGERKCPELKGIFHAHPKGNTEVVINASLYSENTNVINRVWTIVMDKVTDVIDYVMDESIDGDECDDCDGRNKKRTAHAPSQGACGRSKSSPGLENSVKARKSVAEVPSVEDIEQENKVGCNTKNEGDLESKEILDKVSQMPSPLSRNKTRTQTQQEVTNDRLAITVGDLVTVNECPGHWSWASPFTVEAIDGEMVKLEMVGELIEIDRLEKYPK